MDEWLTPKALSWGKIDLIHALIIIFTSDQCKWNFLTYVICSLFESLFLCLHSLWNLVFRLFGISPLYLMCWLALPCWLGLFQKGVSVHFIWSRWWKLRYLGERSLSVALYRFCLAHSARISVCFCSRVGQTFTDQQFTFSCYICKGFIYRLTLYALQIYTDDT